jgi:LemA protein
MLDPIFMLAVLGMALLGLGIYAAVTYNALVDTRNQCGRAWANVDVTLKQRFDEIPNLVAVCKGYMKYEQEVLRDIVAARSAWLAAQSVTDKVDASAHCQHVLHQLYSVAEKYPELKADRLFLELQQRISGLECQIADRRELYNDYVTTFNNRIGQFPDVWIARLFGFVPLPLFAVPAQERVSQYA